MPLNIGKDIQSQEIFQLDLRAVTFSTYQSDSDKKFDVTRTLQQRRDRCSWLWEAHTFTTFVKSKGTTSIGINKCTPPPPGTGGSLSDTRARASCRTARGQGHWLCPGPTSGDKSGVVGLKGHPSEDRKLVKSLAARPHQESKCHLNSRRGSMCACRERSLRHVEDRGDLPAPRGHPLPTSRVCLWAVLRPVLSSATAHRLRCISARLPVLPAARL